MIESIKETIISLVSKITDNRIIISESDGLYESGMNSIDYITLIVELERVYEVEIDNTILFDQNANVSSIAKSIQRLVADKANTAPVKPGCCEALRGDGAV